MKITNVLVVGGYGFFGRRLVARLAALPNLRLYIAGRSLSACKDFEERLRGTSFAEIHSVQLDINDGSMAKVLKQRAIDVVVHTAGPFQGQDYSVAEQCIEAGVNYIDLADGREFVKNISTLSKKAQTKNVFVISGASSVPALSSAAALELAKAFETVHEIDIGITPANKTERGLATARAVLGYCGKPITAQGHTEYGWCGVRPYTYSGPVGKRLLSPCDVPDLDLLSKHFAGNPRISFGAGLELPVLQYGMGALAYLSRKGWVKDWSRYAKPLNTMANALKYFGTEAGAMHVELLGRSKEGFVSTRTWELLADDNEGPYVPTLAAYALIKKFSEGTFSTKGALPCIGLITLSEFESAALGLSITMNIKE